MRRNFTVFALDHATIRELIEDEEPVKARRDAILEQIGGADYPAAMMLQGQAFLLDRTGFDQLEPESEGGAFLALLFVALGDAWALTHQVVPTLIMALTQVTQLRSR